ncbi:2-oxoglutarate (2OG) and Fe(II)-dependent oxygenase superfamily protein [Forsythia ovata]|uniref:2-oxoglutarate (2OG) and Fe(II)-dependent oxygenase superfamily protein n=1 Tax=Forsythia ovata TaxID=205694 RepID=A0ABD1X4C5_9LAMI
MEESLRIRQFNEIPSAEEFAAQIEPRNVPAVFSGCIKNWKAFSKWNPSNGGIDYLQELVGSTVVEAMLSRSAPVFYGDIRSHERVPLPFSTFAGYCKDLLRNGDAGQDCVSESRKHMSAGPVSEQSNPLIGEEAPQQIYLAQIPIMNIENEERVQLKCLGEDIQNPSFLEGKTLSSVNLWMNNAQSRSSTHYDPNHNLLCIIAGCKQVVLWPPSASPFLYPMPLYGEASNHSAIALENPDLRVYPRAEHLDKYSQKVTLHAGDALFIPEGWFHQVDSGSLTIAVNFWWRSDVMSGMLEHMDAYYLRRILKRLTDKEMDRMLCKPLTTMAIATNTGKQSKNEKSGEQSNNEIAGYSEEESDLDYQSVSSKENKLKQRFMLHELEPRALLSLQELISLVHGHVNQSQQAETSAGQSVSGGKDDIKETVNTTLFILEEDPVAQIIWTLHPLILQSVFLAMAHNFPRTLEALLLHALSPVGTEVLTRKFEEMDKLTAEDDRNQFYQKFYSVFDNHFSAMDALLSRKEAFASQAFKNVLDQYLGIAKFNGLEPSIGRDTN